MSAYCTSHLQFAKTFRFKGLCSDATENPLIKLELKGLGHEIRIRFSGHGLMVLVRRESGRYS